MTEDYKPAGASDNEILSLVVKRFSRDYGQNPRERVTFSFNDLHDHIEEMLGQPVSSLLTFQLLNVAAGRGVIQTTPHDSSGAYVINPNAEMGDKTIGELYGIVWNEETQTWDDYIENG